MPALFNKYKKEADWIMIGLFGLMLFDPMTKGHFFGYMLAGYILIFKSGYFMRSLDKSIFWVFLFGATYSLFNALGPNKGAQYLLIQFLFPPVFYFMGRALILKDLNPREITRVLTLIGILFAIPGILTVGSVLTSSGFIAEERSVPNFWTGSSMLATNAATYFIFTLVLPGILLTSTKTFKYWHKALLIGIYVITLLCSFRLGSRTLLALTALSMVVGFAQVLVSQSLINNIRYITVSIIVVFLFLRFAPIDMDAEYLSVLGDRLQDGNASSVGTAGNRSQLWSDAIEKMQKYPLGWQSGHFAHNTWLDIARIAGVIPLAIFIVLNFVSFKFLIRVFDLRPEFRGLTATFTLYTFAILLILFGEPIIVGNFYVICMYFFLLGTMVRAWELKQSLPTENDMNA